MNNASEHPTAWERRLWSAIDASAGDGQPRSYVPASSQEREHVRSMLMELREDHYPGPCERFAAHNDDGWRYQIDLEPVAM